MSGDHSARDCCTDTPTAAGGPSPEAVREALRAVQDPDLGGDVVSAGLVDDVRVDDGVVTVAASFAGLDPEASDELVDRMRGAVLELPGVESAHVESDAPEVGHETAEVEGVDRIVAVASAKGGVGKTTVATQLARGLDAAGETVGLFDADVYGPNVPELLNVSAPIESTDDGRAKPIDASGLQVLSVGCIANDEPLAWRGAMAQEAVLELLADAAWDGVDTLVVDLPPGTGDIVLTALQEVPVDGVVLVTTPFPTAAADTERSATLFREAGVPILGAVVNMAGFTCPSCGDEHAPFGADPDVTVPQLADLPIDEEIREATGEVPDPFVDLGETVEERLSDAAAFELPPHALDLRGVPPVARTEQVVAEFDALDPGEALYAVTDREPGALATVVADRCDGDHAPTIRTDRRGPDEWAVEIRAPACGCGGHGPSHAEHAAGTGR